MRRLAKSTFCLLVVAFWAAGVAPIRATAQGLRFNQPQDVEVEGVITGFDLRTREMAIGSEQGVFVAALDPVRRSRDGRVVGGIPLVQIEIRAVVPPRVLDEDLFIQTVVKIRDRAEVVEPVKEIEVIRALPAAGFRDPGEAEVGAMIPRIDPRDPQRGGLPPMIRGDRPNRRANDDEKEDEASDVETLLVAGRVTSVRAGRVTIAVSDGGSTQRVILPTNDETFVRMVTDDLRRAAVGDAVQARGVSVEPNRFFATELLITHVDQRLQEQGWKDPRNGDALAGEPAAAADASKPPEADNNSKPVDPFEIVKREREGKASDNLADKADGSPAAKKQKAVYHGRTVRIN